MRHAAVLALLLLTAHPAVAHVGDHTHIGIADLAAHLLASDHLAPILVAGLMALVGIGWRARQARVKARARQQEPHS